MDLDADFIFKHLDEEQDSLNSCDSEYFFENLEKAKPFIQLILSRFNQVKLEEPIDQLSQEL